MQYQDIDSLISNLEPSLSAAESQGLAAGMLCVSDRVEADVWLAGLLPDIDEIFGDTKIMLEELFEETQTLLNSDQHIFRLLLPDDDISLSRRLEALSYWCQGFLYGLGSIQETADWSQDSREILKDIAEFAKLDPETEEGEEAESDFMEITEYVRTAVIYLKTELNSGQLNTVH